MLFSELIIFSINRSFQGRLLSLYFVFYIELLDLWIRSSEVGFEL